MLNFLRENAMAIYLLALLAAGIYVLFFWDDPAIRRYEEGLKERERAEKEDAK